MSEPQETEELHDDRLNKLAHEVWPGYDISIGQGLDEDNRVVCATVTLDPLGDWEQVLVVAGEGALEALEAALVVLHRHARGAPGSPESLDDVPPSDDEPDENAEPTVRYDSNRPPSTEEEP